MKMIEFEFVGGKMDGEIIPYPTSDIPDEVAVRSQVYSKDEKLMREYLYIYKRRKNGLYFDIDRVEILSKP